MLTFYILKDVERLNRLLKNALPKAFYQEGRAILLRIHLVLGNWLRGQLVICLFITVMVYIGLRIIGMDYTLVIAIFSGITNIIPYFGPFIGVIPALIIAIPLGMPMLFKVTLVYIVIQQIDGNILSPQIIGDSIGLNPLVIIIALLVGGEIGGFLGLVFAVPVAGIIKAIIEYYAGRKIRIQS